MHWALLHAPSFGEETTGSAVDPARALAFSQQRHEVFSGLLGRAARHPTWPLKFSRVFPPGGRPMHAAKESGGREESCRDGKKGEEHLGGIQGVGYRIARGLRSSQATGTLSAPQSVRERTPPKG